MASKIFGRTIKNISYSVAEGTMLPWSKRPFEVANLLNPAFCSVIIYSAIETYYIKKNQGMPYILSFLILPVVLHKQTREALPKRSSASLHPWFQNHGEIRVGFSRRVQQLAPYTKESIIFGMQTNIIAINEQGELVPGEVKAGVLNWDSNTEAFECREKAKLLGSWYSKVLDISTLFILWGVKP